MKAVQFNEYGGPEVVSLVKVDEPHAGPGQVRIAVRAAGVNPSDWKCRDGQYRKVEEVTFPSGFGVGAGDKKLRFQIANLRRMHFGQSSERMTRQIEPLELQLEALETGQAEDIAGTEGHEPTCPIPHPTKPKRIPPAAAFHRFWI